MTNIFKSVLGIAGFAALLMCANSCGNNGQTDSPYSQRFEEISNTPKYIGDLHNHCNVTYGHGDLDDAVEAARAQLDFCSITPHAMWPDIPVMEDPRLSWVIDYHLQAFRRLRQGGFDKYVAKMERSNEPGKFLTFTSYECHSMEHGDHVALCRNYDTPLLEATSVPDLKEKLRGYNVYVTPHHMGYQEGYRGYNWKAFPENDPQTPFVEMFSRHGLAESDMGDYNYLHDMGPRVYEGSILYGLEQGHKFGLMCSTDQHAGYPGSYGDGRVVVLCDSLDKDAIWDALGKRHIYGVTGDKIDLNFSINGAMMGDVIKGRKRQIFVDVKGQNVIDYVDVVKNGKDLYRMSGPLKYEMPKGDKIHAKVKINFGWNREEQYVHWRGALRLSGGEILSYQTCFRGAAFTSPQPGETEFKTRVNRVVASDSQSVTLDMYSTKNPNVLTPATQGIILEVIMGPKDVITADFNGQQISYTLEDLFKGTKAHFMRGWLSECIQFERAASEEAFAVAMVIEDDQPERDTDYYYIRVRQRDGQWAWSSPIWVEK